MRQLWQVLVAFGLVTSRCEVLGITDGEETQIEEVNYQVALDVNGFLYCGGVLISHTHVLTAAHCAKDNPNLRVRLGSTFTDVDGTLRDVRKIHIHPMYLRTSLSMDYDVAVLELMRPAKFGPKSKPIRITSRAPRVGDIVKVSGYGRLYEMASSDASELQSVEIPVVDRYICQSQLKHFNEVVTSRMFCAGAHGRDSCQGDSGGPAVRGSELVGLVSWGIGCGGTPGVYTNLANPFIRYFIRKVANV